MLKKTLALDSWRRLTRFYDGCLDGANTRSFLLLIGAVISGILEIFGILLLYQLLYAMIAGPASPESGWVAKFLAICGVETKAAYIAVLGSFITVTFVLKNVYLMFYYWYQHHVLKAWQTDISFRLMERYIHAPYVFLIGYSSATLIRNINHTVSLALNGFVLSSFNVVANVIVCALLIGLLAFRYPVGTLMVALVLFVSTTLQSVILRRASRKLGASRDALLAKHMSNVYSGIHALKETKVIGREKYFLSAFREVNGEVIANDSKINLLARLPIHITEITIIVGIVLISMAVLLQNAGDSASSVSSLGVLAAIAFRITPLVNRTISALQAMNKNLSAMDTMLDELDKVRDVVVSPFDREQIVPLRFEKSIECRSVAFAYPDSKQVVLDDVSFVIRKGEMVGICGESGAGKSTLVDLIIGLLEPSKGQLLVDGVPVIRENVKQWQKNIGYVPQSVHLHNDSILRNVAFGVEQDKIDLARVKEALKVAQLDELVAALDGGTDYVIGENGRKLSGGQKQRLGIARALYLDANLLVFDEATGALDVPTESLLTEAVNRLRGKKTILVVAHRLSTIFDADKILFLREGKLEAVGTYSELFLTNKRFARMASLAKILPEGAASLRLT